MAEELVNISEVLNLRKWLVERWSSELSDTNVGNAVRGGN
jgi:hypothetical protein